MNRELFERLRRRLTLWYAGVFALVLLAFGASAYALMGQALMHQVDEANHQAITALLGTVHAEHDTVALSREFHDEVVEARESLGVTFVNAYDDSGRLLAATGGVEARPAGPARESLDVGTRHMRVQRARLQLGDRELGTLVVGRDLKEIDAELDAFIRNLAAAIPLALLVTLLAGAALAGQAMRPVRQAFEQQQRFIADASHELRTPVAVLQTQAEVALEDPHPSVERLREHLQAVGRTASRLGTLVNDLLFLSRAEAAGVPVQARAFFLDELADEVIAELEPLARAGGVLLTFAPCREELQITADPDQLHRLLVVLLENGIKYAGSGGRVTLSAGADAECAWLTVDDTGPGIPEAERKRIFRRFYRLDPARSGDKPGTGLGLAIALAIAQAHHGTLMAEAAPGGGARFRLWLPKKR